MNPRATGWLALATAGIAAFVYFYEIRGEPGRRAAAEQDSRLFPGFGAEGVVALRIKRPEEAETQVSRSPGGWEIVEPLAWPGDPSSLDAMARVLARMTSQGRIEEPAGPAVYGLADDAILVSFSAGGATRGLRIGNETPVGPNVYVALVGSGDEPEAIHMIPSAQASVFDRGTDDLRDRRVLAPLPDEVDRVEIESASGKVVLERDEESWAIVAPERAEADSAKLERLLSDLSVLRAEAFVDEGSLPAADIAIALSSGDAESRRTLKLGPVEGDLRLAEGRDGRLYLVRAALVEHLPTDVRALRAMEPETPVTPGE